MALLPRMLGVIPGLTVLSHGLRWPTMTSYLACAMVMAKDLDRNGDWIVSSFGSGVPWESWE